MRNSKQILAFALLGAAILVGVSLVAFNSQASRVSNSPLYAKRIGKEVGGAPTVSSSHLEGNTNLELSPIGSDDDGGSSSSPTQESCIGPTHGPWCHITQGVVCNMFKRGLKQATNGVICTAYNLCGFTGDEEPKTPNLRSPVDQPLSDVGQPLR